MIDKDTKPNMELLNGILGNIKQGEKCAGCYWNKPFNCERCEAGERQVVMIGKSEARKELSIYEKLKAAGIPIDHHESDLYAKVTDESKVIINDYQHRGQVKTFVNRIDGKLWYDIPFAYLPFWEK